MANDKQMKDIRCGKKFRFAVAVQDEELIAATTPLETMWAGNGVAKWGKEREDVPGSYGKISRPKYASVRSAMAPNFTCALALTRKIAPILLRSCHGKGLVSNYVETGDVDAELDNYVIKGVVPYYNTDADRKLYFTLTNPSGTVYKVEVFMDSAGTIKVAGGQADFPGGAGTIILAEVNNKGIEGTVDIDWTDGESLVNFEIRQLQWVKLDNRYDKFLTLWFEDGKKQYRFHDAVVKSMTFNSVEKSHLRCDVEFHAKGEPLEGSATPIDLPSQFDIYCHKIFYLLRDPATGGFVVTGDVDGELSNWSLTGFVPYINTDEAGKLYATLDEPVPGDYRVRLWKDSGKGAGDLVASGQRTGNGTVILAEENSSGISGTVDVTWTDGETDIIVLFQVSFGVREFSFMMNNELEVFQGNSLYPLALIKEAFIESTGNFKSKLSNETKALLDGALANDITHVTMRAIYSLGNENLQVDFPFVDFQIDGPPAFSESKFDDFDSDFIADSPEDITQDSVWLTLDLVNIP